MAASWAWRATQGTGADAASAVEPWLAGAALLGMVGYLYVALRRVYGQGWLKTALKLALLMLGYVFLGMLAFGLYVIAVVALF
jgi:hypothetical protein